MCQGRLFTAKDLERTDNEIRKFSCYPHEVESVYVKYWAPMYRGRIKWNPKWGEMSSRAEQG